METDKCRWNLLSIYKEFYSYPIFDSCFVSVSWHLYSRHACELYVCQDWQSILSCPCRTCEFRMPSTTTTAARAGVLVTWNILSWSGGHEFNPDQDELVMHSTSVWSCTWTNQVNYSVILLPDSLEPELISCPTSFAVQADGAQQNVTWPEPSFEESHGFDLVIQSTHTSPSVLPWGTTKVTYTATSKNNNRQATCSFSVTVERKCSSLNSIISRCYFLMLTLPCDNNTCTIYLCLPYKKYDSLLYLGSYLTKIPEKNCLYSDCLR